MFNKNHVGRPSNLELRNRKIKKFLIYGVPVLIVVIGIALLSSGSLSNLMGNSVTTYYCEDSTYTLDGTKCTKIIKEKAHLLGDIENNGKINSADAMLTARYVNKNKEFNEFEIAAMDVNKDENIDAQDYQIIFNYASEQNMTENGSMYELGEELVCPSDYKLDGKYCTKTLIVDAKKKVEESKKTYTITFQHGSKNEIMGNQSMESQIVTKGEKAKLHKNEFVWNYTDKRYFSGWTVKTKSGKSYCYKDKTRKEKEFLSGGACNSVILEDEQEISDELLVDDLILQAVWVKESLDVDISTISAITTDIKSKKEIINEIPDLETIYYPNNTQFKFNIYFKIYDKTNDYYYTITKFEQGKFEKNSCKRIEKGKVITETLNLVASQHSSSETTSFSVNAYKDSNCTIPYNSDKSSTNSYLGSSSQYTSKTFNIEYDYNGGKNSNTKGPLSYNYNFDNEQTLLIGSDLNAYGKTTVYKNNYELLGFRVKNEDKKYLCYKDNSKKNHDFMNEENCKKYGYVEYKYNDKLFISDGKNKAKYTLVAQWSNKKKEAKIVFDANCPKGKICESSSKEPMKPMEHVFEGSHTKLTKVNYVQGAKNITGQAENKYNGYYFAGWHIKNSDNNKYFCYTNSQMTTKGYTSEENCKKYEYVVLADGQEIPDEILIENIKLEAQWESGIVTINPVKAKITNVQNGNVSEISNVKDRTYFASGTTVDFKITFPSPNITGKKYYRIVKSTNSHGGTTISNCKEIPSSKEITESLKFVADVNYKNASNKMGIGVILAEDMNKCVNNYKNVDANYYLNNIYNLQTFNVKYEANGGKMFTKDKTTTTVKHFYNAKNPLVFEYSNASERIYRQGYDLIGFKVKNSKDKYICYKNSNKTSQDYTNSSNCNKYGYVIYKTKNQLSRTSSINGETITFIAQWTNNPVTVNIGKLNDTYLSKGTKVTFPITFKINDKENTYYFKWGFLKTGYANLNSKSAPFYPINTFIKNYDALNNISSYYYGDPIVNYKGGGYGPSSQNGWYFDQHNSCIKITSSTKYKPTLTMSRYVNAGIIAVFKDSNCKYMVGSEKNVHKLTEVFYCNNCNS